MAPLKNWDNKTWLSSKKYIQSFNNFLLKQKKLNRNSQILDIGCGRGKIIGSLSSKLKLINKLKEKGLYDNTIIVLWGDHGWHLGDHSLWNKHSNFEQATRSPLLIRVPNQKNQVRVSSPTEFVDIFPTLCELTGVKTLSALQGKSLGCFLINR